MVDLNNLQNTTEEDNTEAREIVVPLFTEDISVSKRVVEKGRVQISRTTSQREELVDELLAREQLEVERTSIGKPIDSMPPVREEGDTIIVPVVEEVLVVERRLVLKEELRIRRVHGTERYQERVTLRKHEATVRRLPAQAPEEEKAAAVSAAESRDRQLQYSESKKEMG